jgi:hypothetical protein
MIIALPMSLAIRVRLPLRTKVALCAIFALGGFIIIMAVVRIIITNNNIGKRPEVSWLNLWSAVEASTAVTVCNLAVFKYLFRGRLGHYSSSPYPQNRKYGGVSARKAERPGDSQRSATYGRNSSSYVRSTRNYSANRGPQTHVTAIPLTERHAKEWDHGIGEIIVTREFDQMTADGTSLYDTEEVDSKKTTSNYSPPSPERAFAPPSGRVNGPVVVPRPAQYGRPHHQNQRATSESSIELILHPPQGSGKFHFGTH